MAEEPLPIVWIGIEELPEYSVNQMIAQYSAEDEFAIAFGHLVLPVILGTAEQRERQAEDVRYVTVKPIVRLGVSRAKLKEFIKVLENTLEKHDKAFGGTDE